MFRHISVTLLMSFLIPIFCSGSGLVGAAATGGSTDDQKPSSVTCGAQWQQQADYFGEWLRYTTFVKSQQSIWRVEHILPLPVFPFLYTHTMDEYVLFFYQKLLFQLVTDCTDSTGPYNSCERCTVNGKSSPWSPNSPTSKIVWLTCAPTDLDRISVRQSHRL